MVTGFQSNKVRALLAFLAAETERPHSRSALAGLLWPDYPDPSALTYLRNALANLRQVIDDAQAQPPFLFISRETIQINPDSSLWIDLRAFEELIRPIDDPQAQIANLRAAIALYRGPFLDGFTCDSSAFEEWAFTWRERLNRLHREALGSLASLYGQRGDYSASIQTARRLLELEPWDEAAHRLVMQGLARSGQRSAALAQYEACRRILQQELGIEPAAETQALLDAIRIGDLDPDGVPITLTEKHVPWVQPHLPAPLTSFIGRETELDEILLMLDCPEEGKLSRGHRVRLLTLVGAGGCGKTRLAIAAAHTIEVDERYPQGVWWVDLAHVSDPGLVLPTVAAAFGLEDSGRTPLIQLLLFYLSEKKILLVLDNAEHLINPTAQLVEKMLESNPDLQILVTSRESLGIPGEKLWRVPSMSFPDSMEGKTLDTDRIRQFDAVRLFEERARTVEPEWNLGGHIDEVIQICTRLEGIPLAIELAAARLHMMTVEQIAERLDDTFHLLTGGSRTTLPRHQTLRACIDWSYNLLSPAESALLRQLSVFHGGLTLEAVENIGKAEPIPGVLPGDILTVFAQLMDRSLVVGQAKGRSMRYRLLDTIRQYAHEKLVEAGEKQAACCRHLAYFLNLAVRAEGELRGPDQVNWHNLVMTELGNFRTAMNWALEKDPLTELRIASALYWFWRIGTRRIFEGLNWLERGLTMDLVLSGPVLGDDSNRALIRGWALDVATWAQGNLLLHESSWTFYQSKPEFEEAVKKRNAYSLEALDIFHRLGKVGRRGYALALFYKPALHLDEQTQEELEESFTIFQEENDKFYSAECLFALAVQAVHKRDFDLAMRYFEQHLALRWEIGDLEGIGYAYLLLGRFEFYLLHIEDAKRFFENALSVYLNLGFIKDYTWRCMSYLAEVAITLGDELEADKYIKLMFSVAKDSGEEWQNSFGLLWKWSYLIHHDPILARSVLKEATAYFTRTGDIFGKFFILETSAKYAFAKGWLNRAARMMSALMHWVSVEIRIPEVFDILRYEDLCNLIRAALGDQSFVKAKSEGEAMNLNQAVAYALEEMN